MPSSTRSQTPYRELSTRAQIARLRPFARQFAAEFGHADSTLSILHHGFNSTFKLVDPDRQKYALRLNTDSKRTVEETATEVAWISALATEPGISVATPQTANNGQYMIEASEEWEGRPLRAVLYTWLGGRRFPRDPRPDQFYKVGQATKVLHDHALTFDLPHPDKLNTLPDVLLGKPYVAEQYDYNLDHTAIKEAADRANDVLKKLHAHEPQRLIHYDLHMGNMKLEGGRLNIFDFDDCLLAWPAIDASVTFCHFRQKHLNQEIEAAYWQGYGSSVESMGVTPQEMEDLVVGRAVMLINEVVAMTSAAWGDFVKAWLESMGERVVASLKTGVYYPSVSIPKR